MTQTEDHAVLRLTGPLTAANVRGLGGALSELIRGHHHDVVIDAQGITEIAPICVGVLNRAAAELRRAGGTLTLHGLDAAGVRRLMDAGLHRSVLVT